MKRRQVMGAAGVAVLVPFGTRAQQAKVPVIGVLADTEQFWRMFRAELRRLGYIDGQTVNYEFRSAQGQLARLPELAAELVRLKVDVIVAWPTPAALAAKQATRDIPIVMTSVGDPLASGLIESLGRPGGNITGMSGMASDLAGKCVELSRELLPQAKRVVALLNASDPFSKAMLDKIQAAGKVTGMEIEAVLVHKPDELDAAFAALEKAATDTVIVQPSLPMQRIVELTIKHRLPALSPAHAFAEFGGLIEYAADLPDLYRRAADMVVKVLKGTKPADLPVEQPTKYSLVINLKTAKAIGVAVPRPLVQRADEVIE